MPQTNRPQLLDSLSGVFIGHSISALIIEDVFDAEIAIAYDLHPVVLSPKLTMFFVNHYYGPCWAKMLNIEGWLEQRKTLKNDALMMMFPAPRVYGHIVQRITRKSEPRFAIIETDYFGGVGDQYARLYKGDGVEASSDSLTAISPVLAQMGVEKGDAHDEFDAVGLDKHRAGPDDLDKYNALSLELDL